MYYSTSLQLLFLVAFLWSGEVMSSQPCGIRGPLREKFDCEWLTPPSTDSAHSITNGEILCPLSPQVTAIFNLLYSYPLTEERREEEDDGGGNFDEEEQETLERQRWERGRGESEDATRVRLCFGMQDVVGEARDGAGSWSISFRSYSGPEVVVTTSMACLNSSRANTTSCLMEVRLSANVWNLSQVHSSPADQHFWICEKTMEPRTLHVHKMAVNADWLHKWLISCPSLEAISLEDLDLGAQTLKFHYLPRLQELHLQGFIRLPSTLWKMTPELRTLSLRNCLLNGAPEGVSALRHLRVLIIDADQGYAFYPLDFGPLGSLQELHLTRCGALDVAALHEMPPLPRLRILRLSWSATLTFDADDRYDYFGKFPDLEELDMSHCGLRSICHSLLRPATGNATRLKVLRLAHNALETVPPLHERRLQVLDLSFNAVEEPTNLGALNTTVGFLNLSVNAVKVWNDSDVFSLRGNGFVDRREFGDSWVESVDLTLNEMVALSNPMTDSLNPVTSVDLRGNSFDCSDCDVLRWTRWIVSSGRVVATDELSCASPPAAEGLLLSDAAKGPAPCVDVGAEDPLRHWVVVAAPLLALILVAVLVVAIAGVRFRAEIAYMMHLLRIRKARGEGGQESLYDAFICFSGRDRTWVTRVLVPLLEAAPLRYRLCLHDRDFPLGALIVDNIVEAIERSRRAVIVLSPHFVASKWCQWELDMARHRCFEDSPAFIVLIQLGSLERKRLPRHLRFLCDTRTFLEWPVGGAGAAMGAVRQRLKDALGPSLREQLALAAPTATDAFHDEAAAAHNATKQQSLHRALVAIEADASGIKPRRDVSVRKMTTSPAIKGMEQTALGDAAPQGKPFEGEGKGLKAVRLQTI